MKIKKQDKITSAIQAPLSFNWKKWTSSNLIASSKTGKSACGGREKISCSPFFNYHEARFVYFGFKLRGGFPTKFRREHVISERLMLMTRTDIMFKD